MTTPDFSLTALFLLGLLGAAHCVGMCGPLAVVFPCRLGGVRAHLIYHAGRIAAYIAVGFVMGGTGAGMVGIAVAAGGDPMAWIARIQVILSLVAALFLLLFGAARMGLMPEPEWMAAAAVALVPGFGHRVRRAGGIATPLGMLVPGFFNGLLPCGLSFAAFARALAAADPLAGGLMAAAFGLGTLPGLLLIGTGAAFLFQRHRLQLELLSGMVMIAMGLSLLADAAGALFG